MEILENICVGISTLVAIFLVVGGFLGLLFIDLPPGDCGYHP